MALRIDRTPEGYIRVVETLMSFMGTDVKVILYDMENNKKKVNDNNWCEMNKSCREWVVKYYLPKVSWNFYWQDKTFMVQYKCSR